MYTIYRNSSVSAPPRSVERRESRASVLSGQGGFRFFRKKSSSRRVSSGTGVAPPQRTGFAPRKAGDTGALPAKRPSGYSVSGDPPPAAVGAISFRLIPALPCPRKAISSGRSLRRSGSPVVFAAVNRNNVPNSKKNKDKAPDFCYNVRIAGTRAFFFPAVKG